MISSIEDHLEYMFYYRTRILLSSSHRGGELNSVTPRYRRALWKSHLSRRYGHIDSTIEGENVEKVSLFGPVS
jgi:hypothetical protein